ncbi:MAG: hypothetical protein JST85_07515 [Acidobacteria bacterium]|nr:hypothetical protein [Acidobacteriota bacterium]
MQFFLLASIGIPLIRLVDSINYFARLAINIIIGIIAVLLILRWLMDAFDVSPFGRISYYLRRPTDKLLAHARSSRFYYPMRQAFKFNPTILIALIEVAIVWFVLMMLSSNLAALISDLALSLDAFNMGYIVSGVRYLIGTLLIAAIFFLMCLMTVIFINWITGLLDRWSFHALERLTPMLRVFEFGGKFAGWSFFFLWLALYFAAVIIQSLFF